MTSKILYDADVLPALQHPRKQPKVEKNDHFEIQRLETIRSDHHLLSGQQERLQYFEIIWMQEGTGTIAIDAVHHPFNNDMIYCLTPGQVRQCKLQHAPKGYYISFSQDFLYRWATYTMGNTWLDTHIYGMGLSMISSDADMQYEIEDLMTKMSKEYCNHYLLRSEVLAGLLNILVIYFSRRQHVRVNELAQSKEIELVQRFISLVKVHFRTMKFVADYASELCVTANHLNRIVKKITGTPASSHIQQHIIMEAKRQALHSNVSMKEIAYLLGFDDHSHFSKYFKNNSGMNFTSFKKGLTADAVL
ncbi:helix-turn-helix domain-containing protein [Chitinophaga rhizophila]|uniref:Helix-turn-helix domain-containing protein n=1 Tax=Chitinophaga rhizophila TaxID=2866212 RepID=A0ABS7GND8_9BACT|nr:helix-turn-helix domain-containing protein [Chitinophaga rhizophila]MBW8688348.1 helix-turn-helix domain-containing protein [Chitinophaga rhizophila]